MPQLSKNDGPARRRVLLIGWDSADWKIIDKLIAGDGLPGVHSLLNGGVRGNLATLEPQLSPMLWTSIATGKMAYHHGVHGFTEVDPVSGRVVPVSAASRRCKALWEMLGEQGLRSHLVGWFATQGERDLDGKMVSNMFGHLKGADKATDPDAWPPPPPGTFWPEELADAMNSLRVAPHEIDADVLHPFVPDGARIDLSKDRRLWSLMVQLAETFSIQAAATHLMETDPEWDFMAIYFRAIDEISHFFMPFHPPKLEGISQEDFEIYRHVIDATYRVHDMMLDYLVKLAGPETTVILVSDHGFHSDHLRPAFTPQVPAGITVWHRPQGIFAAKGLGISETPVPVYGARLLDITPTLLHLFGLPVGADMEGRVLKEIFRENEPVRTIPTWESDGGKAKARGSLSAAESEALLEQFIALGYIDELSPDPTEAAAGTERENKWNLARACLYAKKYEDALPLLEDCHAECPARPDFGQLLARVQLNLGLTDEAEKTLEEAAGGLQLPFHARLLRTQIAREKGIEEEALAELTALRKESPDHPQVLEYLCRAATNLRRWELAREAGEALLELDADSAQARITLARVCHSEKYHDDAAAHAMTAIELQFGDPRGHFLLGRALANLGQTEEAIHALTNCLKLAPDHANACSQLVRLLRDAGKPDEAAAVEAQVMNLRNLQKREREVRLPQIRREVQLRAEARALKPRSGASGETDPGGSEPKTFTLVSGLPRSGTSLMMQMLSAAGLPVMTDGKRAPDDDNPEGYHEWEDIKSLRRNPRLLEEAEGKVVKIITALLPALPPRHHYRIVFMKRPLEEVVTSQWRMLERKQLRPASERDHLIRTQQIHLDEILGILRKHPKVDLLEIDYPDLVRDPEPQLASIREFFGSQLPEPDKLGAPINPGLYRNQS